MDYEFTTDIGALDYFRLSMYNTYHSLVGVVNLVFFASMIAVCWKFWNVAGDVPQTFMFLGVILVPIIHPFVIMMKARAQALLTPKGTQLAFDSKGIHVTLNEKKETIRWNKIPLVVERCGMVIIYSGANHGYILTGRVLKNKKKEFIKYLQEHCK